MAKIYRSTVPDAFCYGFYQSIAKNTQVFSPTNNFGLVRQNSKILTVFDESVKVNKKDIPDLKAPFFGKIHDLLFYFYPYGVSDSFSKTDYVFNTKDGKRVKISFNAKYDVAIENPRKAFQVNDYLQEYYPRKGGVIADSIDFNNLLVKYIAENSNPPFAELTCTAEWATPFTPDSKRAPQHAYMMSLRGSIAMTKFFESIGYKVNSHDFKIIAFELLD